MDATSTTDENAENVTNVQKDNPAAVATKNFKMAPTTIDIQDPKAETLSNARGLSQLPPAPEVKEPPAPEEEGNSDFAEMVCGMMINVDKDTDMDQLKVYIRKFLGDFMTYAPTPLSMSEVNDTLARLKARYAEVKENDDEAAMEAIVEETMDQMDLLGNHMNAVIEADKKFQEVHKEVTKKAEEANRQLTVSTNVERALTNDTINSLGSLNEIMSFIDTIKTDQARLRAAIDAEDDMKIRKAEQELEEMRNKRAQRQAPRE
jgi:hypothetical protein